MTKANIKLKILIVDDSDIIVSRIKELLSELKEASIVGTAGNYEDAIHMVEHHIPDIVLLDIGLPGKSGVDILKEVKRRHNYITVIMLTNQSELHYRVECAREGSDYFFDKSTEFERVPEVLVSLMAGNQNR